MEYIRPTYTPERIISLQPGEIFVFGSNLQGMHGGGAARMAYEKFGAIWGKGVGLQGQCYAIPTMQGGVDTIRPYVEEFVAFAKEHKELTFLVTPIGCGIAGFKSEDIAPLFKEAIVEENIVLPESFEEVIMQIRPLSKATIDVLAKRMQAKNPYSVGTLSHGIWEHQHYFELLWNGGLRKEDLYEISNPDFLFFWGHHGKPGETTKACLSQWFPCKFTVNGIHYNCAEQFMMAEKARIMGDEDTRNRILASTDPKEIKALGREVQNFDEYKWQKHRMEIVITGNLHKFMDNEELKVFLLATRNKILVEASPYDTVWGIGMKEDDPDCRNPRLWKGENLLGFALMDVREKLSKI